MDVVLRFFKEGGFIMYPLLICSLLLITLIIERAITLRRMNGDGDVLLEEVKRNFPGKKDDVLSQCKSHGALGRVVARGLRNADRNADAIEMAMEQAANELPTLDANLPIIKTIVNIAPLLGLLGTIAGMIGSFRVASQAGLSNPSQILGGISEALIATATGISLAVIGFISYNYFANQSKKIVEDIEYYGAELVNVLTGRVS